MRVACRVGGATLEGDQVPEVEGVRVTCPRCKHHAEAFGQSDASIRAALTKLREICPKGERNFYVDAVEERQRPPYPNRHRGLIDPWAPQPKKKP